MSNNTFTLQNIDRVNFYGKDSEADVYLEGVSTGTSGVCVNGSLFVTDNISVNGNVFSNFGISGLGGTSPGLCPNLDTVFELITPEEFVNGVYFPQVVTYYNDLGNNRAVYRVKVPNWVGTSGISARFPELANPGFRNSFETTFYGTCTLPVSGSTNTSPIITIMNQGDTVFDNRLFPSGSGTSLTFSLVSDSNISLTNGYGSGVTIKSIVHSSGISMYPVGTVNYRTVEITGGGGGGGGGSAPTLTTAEVPSGSSGTYIDLTYSGSVQLNGSAGDVNSYYSLTGGTYSGSISSISVTGSVVTLFLSPAVSQGETILLTYDDTDSYIISDPDSVAVAGFTDESITNSLP